MTVRHADDWLTIHGGDCRDVLATLPDESVNCVVTSPPYWGLRDYGTATWDGGDASCDHIGPPLASSSSSLAGYTSENVKLRTNGVPYRDRCGKCGATRQDRQLGLEPTPEEYVANMVAVFREVRRVLRDDGTLWLNLGDSYAGGGTIGRNDTGPDDIARRSAKYGTGTGAGSAVGNSGTRAPVAGLKPKDLVGIPWRVAFALQADGWYLRSDIIWAKPNPMPESVTDRPTKAHEYLFLLSKSARYWYDADAVREPHETTVHRKTAPTTEHGNGVDYRDLAGGKPRNRSGKALAYAYTDGVQGNPAGRNRRSVWTVATQPYPGAHFAVMPEALVEPCVLAGCPDKACGECGAPWERVVERVGAVKNTDYANESRSVLRQGGKASTTLNGIPATSLTTGWRPTCAHADAPTVPGVTLDPFGGSGTVARVANRLSRRAVLIDLNPEYLEQQMKRNSDMPLGLTAA